MFRYGGAFDGIISMFTSATGISVEIIFPIGFSYYMFKNLSYLFDVHLEKIKSEEKFHKYLLYVSYFPEIFMGPISRAEDFLPQIGKEKKFDTNVINQSFILILIAFAKKLLIADRIAVLINPYIAEGVIANGLSWLVICLAFAVQLYLDFSAYTDISIAVSNVLGYKIKPNFRAPYFSQTISDYWRRWHISLSSWLSDYIFKPLQFSIRRLGIYASVAAAIITLIISGLWHGSTLNWFFYGLCMGIIIGIDALFAKKRKKIKKILPKHFFNITSNIITMFIVVVLSVFIISTTSDEAFFILKNIFNPFSYSLNLGMDKLFFIMLLVGICATVVSHLIELKKDGFLQRFFNIPIVFRYIIYLLLIFAIILFGVSTGDYYGGFIYAQF
ncbi:MAG: MBOAT family O-acyltransferase [Christensenellaceae bacterium]